MLAQELIVRPESPAEGGSEARLIALVLDGVTSEHSRRSYRTGLTGFFAWIPLSGSNLAFTKALVQQYRARLIGQKLSSSTINLRLASIRKLAREMTDNQMLDPAIAAAIEAVPCVKKRGTRIGKWLSRDEASRLVNAPSGDTLSGKRDRAILAILVSCGLRCAEVLRMDVRDLQQREGRWVLSDMMGKGNRIRTVTVPEGVKARIDLWLNAAGVTSGPIFRGVNKRDEAMGRGLADEKAVWRLVMRHAGAAGLGRLAPHDLRRTIAKLCRKAGGELEQIH